MKQVIGLRVNLSYILQCDCTLWLHTGFNKTGQASELGYNWEWREKRKTAILPWETIQVYTFQDVKKKYNSALLSRSYYQCSKDRETKKVKKQKCLKKRLLNNEKTINVVNDLGLGPSAQSRMPNLHFTKVHDCVSESEVILSLPYSHTIPG